MSLSDKDKQAALEALRKHYGVLVEDGVAIAFTPTLNDLFYFYKIGMQAAYEKSEIKLRRVADLIPDLTKPFNLAADNIHALAKGDKP